MVERYTRQDGVEWDWQDGTKWGAVTPFLCLTDCSVRNVALIVCFYQGAEGYMDVKKGTNVAELPVGRVKTA